MADAPNKPTPSLLQVLYAYKTYLYAQRSKSVTEIEALKPGLHKHEVPAPSSAESNGRVFREEDA